ncbi:hypothetical protein [Streptomyces sp. NPDC060198]|uniref:hypothetical protein n=1 Tax=Streptomyces sp. NPDC060198 TaxID=3347070 RepID=UPI003655534A
MLSGSASGHSGAAGSQAFADPEPGVAYGYTRRRYAYPGGEAPENTRLVEAVVRAARGARRGLGPPRRPGGPALTP